MHGGEIFVPKIPSMRILDLVEAIAPGCEVETIGIRPGEKLHELMIGEDDARHTVDGGDHYAIHPEFRWYNGRQTGPYLPEGFCYRSDLNTEWLSVPELRAMVAA